MRPHAGFSLLEVMLAFAILVIGLFTVISAMGMSSQVRQRSRALGLATQAAQAEIERLQALGFDSTYNGKTFGVQGLQPLPGRSAVGTITRAPDSTPSLLHLIVTLQWLDASGPMETALHYYFVNRGG